MNLKLNMKEINKILAKTHLKYITEILLKVVLSTIKPTIKLFYRIDRCFCLSEKKTLGYFRAHHTEHRMEK
jgi:hypothetical protein